MRSSNNIAYQSSVKSFVSCLENEKRTSPAVSQFKRLFCNLKDGEFDCQFFYEEC